MKVEKPRLVNQQETVVPAEPGFNLVCQVVDTNCLVVDLWRVPILAWRVTIETFEYRGGDRSTSSTTEPVTLGPDCGADCNWAVEYPDGRCDLPWDRAFDNAAELLKYWQEDPGRRYQPAVSELEIGDSDPPKM